MTSAACLAAIALAACAVTAQQPSAGRDPATTILSMGGNWRAFYALKGPFIRNGDTLEQKNGEVDTPPPAANWREVDFDDASWHRLSGQPCVPHYYGQACRDANAGFAYTDGSSPFQSLICQRGRFLVTDVNVVEDMILTVEYRGGVVICLNGKEIARGNMPAGEITPDTLAADYSYETFLLPDGKPQREDWREKDIAVIESWKRIKRRLGDVRVPARLLRKGVNVLAVEVHRSAYPAAYAEELSKHRAYESRPYVRSTCGITELVLKSTGGRGIEPNVVRSEGVQVWNSGPLDEADYGYGNPLEPLRPVRIAACRRGAFIGQVTVSSREPLKGLVASMSALEDAKTGAVIPAANAIIRYGSALTPPDEAPVSRQDAYHQWTYADTPADVPGAVMPVRVTVRVPEDARPGEYAGTLTIQVEGAGPFAAPVALSVSRFTLPEPRDYRTIVDIIQSPDTLAMQYGVPLWSEAHWKLIDRSFEVLGAAGLDAIYLPLIAETHFGNAESMVRWIRRADGKYDYDFSILEKYLDAYERHCGRPRIVCLYAWDLSLEGGSNWVNKTMGFQTDEVVKQREEHAKLALGPQVTAFDPATGKAELLQLPQYSEDVSFALWQPLGDKLRALLKAHGCEDRAMLGIPLDPKPTEGVIRLFERVLPGTPWMVQDHIYVKAEKIHGAPVAYQANYFLNELRTHDLAKSAFGTPHPELRLMFDRGLTGATPPHGFRLLSEMLILSGLNGFGRLGGDLWPVMADKRGRKHALPNRYPKTNAGGLSVWTCLLAPGPEGAVATNDFEMLREGVQETEARIVVESALLEGKISGALAQRAREALARRNMAVVVGLMGKANETYGTPWWEHNSNYGYGGSPKSGYLYYLSSGYRERAAELFDLAAEVTDALNGGNAR